MRHFITPYLSLLALLLSCLAASSHAAPHRPLPLKGRLIRTIDNRVTVFYQYKTKDGKCHKTATVSRTVFVKVVKPSKPVTP